MSKKCVNCGKKISILEDSFTLPNQRESFCKECSRIARPLLRDIMTAASDKSYENAKRTFEEALPEATLSDEAKKYIKYEFDDIAASATKISESGEKNAKTFNGSFSACCDAILKAGKTASGNEPVAPMQIVKLPAREVGKYYIVTAVFECFYIRTGSYASLTVTMIWFPQLIKKGKAIVSAVASGGGKGLLNISWGAEDDFIQTFWRALRDQNPELKIKEYGEALFDTEIEFMQGPPSEEEMKTSSDPTGRESAVKPTNRIGILGGTFDPVHIGHISLGIAAISEASLEKLIIMPAYIQPFKQGKRVTDDEHRLAMANLAFKDIPKTEISTLEIDRMRISYTFDTMSELKKQYPGKELFFITGTDAFMQIDSWYKGVDLLENFSFIVSARPGYYEDELNETIKTYQRLYNTQVIKLVAKMPDISSTDIREAYRNGESISSLVPEAVERYIKDNGLYE